MKLVILAIVTGGLLGALVAYLWCSSPAYTRAMYVSLSACIEGNMRGMLTSPCSDDPGTVAMLTFGEFGDPVVVDNVLRFWEETRPPSKSSVSPCG